MNFHKTVKREIKLKNLIFYLSLNESYIYPTHKICKFIS